MREELDARGFHVCAIASPFLKCDRGDDPDVQDRVHERALEAASVLSAPVVRAFAYWREPDPGAALTELGAALRRAAARASDAGVTLGLENEHECNVATSDEAKGRARVRRFVQPASHLGPRQRGDARPGDVQRVGGLETIDDRSPTSI